VPEIIPVGEFDAARFCGMLDEIEQRLPDVEEVKSLNQQLAQSIEVQAITEGPPLNEAERAVMTAWAEVVTAQAELAHRIIARLREGFCER